MTKEEYKEHLCGVIRAVFIAEDAANKKKQITSNLKNRVISPDDYVSAIADEMLSSTPDEHIERM